MVGESFIFQLQKNTKLQSQMFKKIILKILNLEIELSKFVLVSNTWL
jgi:hypothetical protein